MRRLLTFCLVAWGLAPGQAHATDPTPMLVNGSFEEWREGVPVGWTVLIGDTEGDGAESLVEARSDAQEGDLCLSLSGDHETRRWNFLFQEIEITPGEIFRFSGWTRANAVFRDRHRNQNAQIAAVAKSAKGQRVNTWILGPATGTTDWVHDETYFQAPPGAARLEVSAFLSMSGRCDFDAIALEKLAAPKADPDAPRVEQWRADLAYLSDFLPRLHVDPFTMLSEDDFRSQVEELDADLFALSDAQIELRLMEVVASLGDAHTTLVSATRPATLPVAFEFFGEELRVMAIDDRFDEILGGVVTEVGGYDLSRVLAELRRLIPCETESWFRHRAPQFLSQPALLHTMGFSESDSAIALTARTEEGIDLTVAVTSPEPGQPMEIAIAAPPEENKPLYLSNFVPYWSTLLEGGRTLYIQYNQCREDPTRPLAEFVEEIDGALEENAIDRVILDLRLNSGGSSYLFQPVLRSVAAWRSKAKAGDCYVITGPGTFSAACLNALTFRKATGALVVGEPMGNKPNRFGQLNAMELPNSGLRVQYATKHFVMMEGDPPMLVPDIPASPSWDDHMAGRDVALEKILARD